MWRCLSVVSSQLIFFLTIFSLKLWKIDITEGMGASLRCQSLVCTQHLSSWDYVHLLLLYVLQEGREDQSPEPMPGNWAFWERGYCCFYLRCLQFCLQQLQRSVPAQESWIQLSGKELFPFHVKTGAFDYNCMQLLYKRLCSINELLFSTSVSVGKNLLLLRLLAVISEDVLLCQVPPRVTPLL